MIPLEGLPNIYLNRSYVEAEHDVAQKAYRSSWASALRPYGISMAIIRQVNDTAIPTREEKTWIRNHLQLSADFSLGGSLPFPSKLQGYLRTQGIANTDATEIVLREDRVLVKLKNPLTGMSEAQTKELAFYIKNDAFFLHTLVHTSDAVRSRFDYLVSPDVIHALGQFPKDISHLNPQRKQITVEQEILHDDVGRFEAARVGNRSIHITSF